MAYRVVLTLGLSAAASALVLPPRAPPRGAATRPLHASMSAPEMGQTALALLRSLDAPQPTAEVLLALFAACTEVSSSIATASCDSFACFNNFGNMHEQVAIDLLAEQVLFDRLRETGRVCVASSVSDKVMQPLSAEGELSISLYPIDASSVMETNFAVGTIFGVWGSPHLVNVTGRQLVAAGTCSYGPRTVLNVALAGCSSVYELVLVDGEWLVSNCFSSMGEGKLFAPGNLRVLPENPGYASLVQYWQDNRYQLRYTGGLVCDVTQLLVKGYGIFVSPSSPDRRPSLRTLYEALPMAFLIEKAGGASSDGRSSLLEIMVTSPDDRTQVALGSADEVARFEEMVGPLALSAEKPAMSHN
ncbi:hypothetical protein AB1Y20_008205 [Prymnesium parvum]|uniref:Fructose-bisphosphatase n=1 Tax=Prymnesium parvum TaxID=97485 RepID=A0AB34IUS8_PRYPA|mmetsp:Transcript_11388/g.28169  ORF Transcript_11388/g.28169 Transcript_11388/m.28169 type:complete len:360 (+) Transcript_11388:162-1241(+)